MNKTNPIGLRLDCAAQNVAYFLLHRDTVACSLKPESMFEFVVEFRIVRLAMGELEMITLLSV